MTRVQDAQVEQFLHMWQDGQLSIDDNDNGEQQFKYILYDNVSLVYVYIYKRYLI